MATRTRPDVKAVVGALRKVAEMVESGFVVALDAQHRESGVVLPPGEYHVYSFNVTYGLDSELPEEVMRALAIGRCCKEDDGARASD